MRYLIVLAFLLVGCTKSQHEAQRDKLTEKYLMTCSRHLAAPNSGVYRCENDEATCYAYGESITCKWKGIQ
jgi:hypothetical protein